MNDNAKALVAALRSGNYKQAQQRLRSGNKYCCLGVACDLYAHSHPEARWRRLRDGWWFYPGSMYRKQSHLPPPVKEWVGFASSYGDFTPSASSPHASLIELNDDLATFPMIADIIESEPEGLFA